MPSLLQRTTLDQALDVALEAVSSLESDQSAPGAKDALPFAA